ncbi:Ig-like domain-containing protein [Thiohalomonas denitrificans]|uniref:Ig-like domain-containing protein n=1 Tax=Thiohalomonas denitrificans TaxID=415747 RepID=UPI0026F2C2F5|nr:Ig-like domain-containing protein [Thiohalomonas denitrificans]
MKVTRTRSALCAALVLAGGSAGAKEVHLIAAPLTKIMPDGVQLTQWGFAEDLNANGVLDGTETSTSPGPIIDIPPEDPGLTITLHNTLSAPVSLIIPGEASGGDPVFTTDAQGRRRARSLTHETAPGGTGTYSWPSLSAGSHVYHSATSPQMQVPMGLYGGITKDAAAGEPYPGVAATTEALLFFSEIDPALNAAITSGEYGTAAYPSSVDYSPKYFLINGEPYQSGVSTPIAAGAVGEPTLLRLFNMGLNTHVPVLQGSHLQVVAEDGFAYPYLRQQYSVTLSPAKTRDAVFTPQKEGVYPIYDRRLNLTDAGRPGGGMLSGLQVGTVVGTPIAVDDGYATDEDQPLAVAAPGVLGNDESADGTLTATLDDPVSAGSLNLEPDGSFTYTPPPDFSGSAVFSYRADDGTLQSAPATVTLIVNPTNDAPVGTADSYAVNEDTTLTVAAPGVLSNDSDPDGDTLTAATAALPDHGTLALESDGGFAYTPDAGYTGPDSFTYTVSDGTVSHAEVLVSLTVQAAANIAPMASDDQATTPFREPVTINVLSNDSDPDGDLEPASVTVVTQPLHGSAIANADGTITYTPSPGFRGSDAFGYTVADTEGALSNEATVRVDVIK